MRAFGGRRAVDRVDVAVPAGTRLAVVGPNGAGKSTLLRMLATLSRPDAGTLRIAGWDCPDGARRARARIGYLGHDPLVYLDLSPWQNLELFASLYGVTGTRELITASLAQVGLLARAHDPVRTFSRGMAQRLGIARLTLHGPSVLLLDEPYTGLDAQGARLLDGLLGDTAAGRSVVMVTHELGRALALADRVMVMRAGRVVHLEDTAATDGDAFAERYRELTA